MQSKTDSSHSSGNGLTGVRLVKGCRELPKQKAMASAFETWGSSYQRSPHLLSHVLVSLANISPTSSIAVFHKLYIRY